MIFFVNRAPGHQRRLLVTVFPASFIEIGRLLKPFMRYRGNKICPDERTNEREGQTARQQMPSPTLTSGEAMEIAYVYCAYLLHSK